MAACEAITCAQAVRHPFDVLLLDLNLPDQTGWDVLRWMDATAAGLGPPRKPRVIIITAAHPAQRRLEEFRPDALLIKPFPIDALLCSVDRVLGLRYGAEAEQDAQKDNIEETTMDTDETSAEQADSADNRQAHAAPFIEYWVWHEGELIPATAQELAWIREREREREARWRLYQWTRLQADAARLRPARAAQALGAAMSAWLVMLRRHLLKMPEPHGPMGERAQQDVPATEG